MANQPAEAYYCRKYLINCFVHPLVAVLFTTWAQVQEYENESFLQLALSPQVILDAAYAAILDHKSFYDNPDYQ